jgi:hypothetical protein
MEPRDTERTQAAADQSGPASRLGTTCDAAARSQVARRRPITHEAAQQSRSSKDYTLDYPPSVVGGIYQIAEYINMLWGHSTPDGQTFNTHVHRRPRVVGLSPPGDASAEPPSAQVSTLAPEYSTYVFSVLLAADDELHQTLRSNSRNGRDFRRPSSPVTSSLKGLRRPVQRCCIRSFRRFRG